MHKEFAIDPTLLCTFDRVRAILDSCGWHKGKVVCEYPKRHWKRMVYDACKDVTGKEKLKIVQLLESPIFVRRLNATPYDKDRGWFVSTIQEHTRKPFTAILDKGENSHHDVMDGRYVTEGEPKWQALTGIVIRQADEFAKAIELLAQNSSKIVFVDPYFDFAAPRYTNSLLAMLETTIQDYYKRSPADNSNGITIELHLRVKRDPANTDDIVSRRRDIIERQLPRSIPMGVVIKVFLWDEKDENSERFHNRYFLTDMGGILFGIGLDVANSQISNTSGQTDDIFRMTPEQHRSRSAQYCSGSNAFEYLDSFSVVGNKTRRSN